MDLVGMEPQGEQAQMDMRDWDGDPRADDEDGIEINWLRLLDVYAEVEQDGFWEHLRQPGIKLVRGDGQETAETARVMVVGEAPGAQENGAGRPFVGASGKVLDQLLGLAGLGRENVFITNVVKYRPPGNRTPNLAEVLHGQKTLRKEWSILRPTLTIAVGATAHLAVHPQGGLMSLSSCRNGAPWPYRPADPSQGYSRYAMSIYHPAYGMRKGKRVQDMIERDWEALGEWIKEEMPDVRRA